MLREGLAKRLACRVIDARDHVLQAELGGADGAHAVVDAAGAETTLDYFEATAFAEYHVRDRDAAVGEDEFAVAVGGVCGC